MESEPLRRRRSYSEILRATSVVGGGKALGILVKLIRSKVLAILLGPSGIGVMGVLQGVMGTAATVFGLGLGSSGVRQIAAAGSDLGRLSCVRKALWRSNLALGLVGLGGLWLFRAQIASLVFGDVARSNDVAWLGVGVLATLIAASQTALLQGMRKIGDMVKAGIVGAIIGAAVGLLFVWRLGAAGIPFFVIATPVFTVVGSSWYVRLLPKVSRGNTQPAAVWAQWRQMTTLGLFIMVSTVIGGVAVLAVKAILTRRLGLDAAGYFQAATAISGNYLGIVLGAMAADYYPRLSSAIDSRFEFNNIVNDQLEVALLLIAPILLGVLALLPWILSMLYTNEFQTAAVIMRWQILGDVLKVPSWAIGFIILAHGSGRLYLTINATGDALFVASVLFLLPWLHIEAAGVAFLVQLAYSVVLVYWIANRHYNFKMRASTCRSLIVLFVAAGGVSVVSRSSPVSAAVLGVPLCLIAAARAIKKLLQMRLMS